MSFEQVIGKRYVLGVDVGTTNIKCCVYDHSAHLIGITQKEVSSLVKGKGYEIQPNILWAQFTSAVQECLKASSLTAHDVACIGISTQRGTFLTWDRDTGEPFHNFISWKDKTTQDLCKKWNSSFYMKVVQFGALLLYCLTFMTAFQVYATIKFSSAMVLPRLYLVLQSIPEVRMRCNEGRVLFGTMDTWLLWKMTGKASHFTDPSNACITGFYDQFKMRWSSLILRAFNIPANILPEVLNTSDSFGETEKSLFGCPIPICSLVGDQQASTFGAGCFQKYDMNCTMGTGSFLAINCGDKPSKAYPGLYPIVGWTINSQTTYLAECGVHFFGPTVKWLQRIGFINDPKDSHDMSESVECTQDVYFVPTQRPEKPLDNGKFAFINLDLKTRKEHLVRAVMESLSFQVVLLLRLMSKVFGKRKNAVRINGGVSQNDMIVQLVCDISGRRFERVHCEASSLGAAMLAGLHIGYWESFAGFKDLELQQDVFLPAESVEKKLQSFKKWKSFVSKTS